MHRHDVIILASDTTPYTSEFLHVGTDTQEQSQVDTQSPNISTSLTRHPKYTKVSFIVVFNQLGLVDCSNTKLTLDGGDEGRSLEKGASEGLQSSRQSLFVLQLVVESNHTHVFLSCTLLGLDQSSSTVDTDNQTTSDLGIKGT